MPLLCHLLLPPPPLTVPSSLRKEAAAGGRPAALLRHRHRTKSFLEPAGGARENLVEEIDGKLFEDNGNTEPNPDRPGGKRQTRAGKDECADSASDGTVGVETPDCSGEQMQQRRVKGSELAD